MPKTKDDLKYEIGFCEGVLSTLAILDTARDFSDTALKYRNKLQLLQDALAKLEVKAEAKDAS